MATLNKNTITFVVHMAALSKTLIYPSRKIHIEALIAKEIPTKILAEYLDSSNVFSLDVTIKLPKYTGINNPSINHVARKQLLHD